MSSLEQQQAAQLAAQQKQLLQQKQALEQAQLWELVAAREGGMAAQLLRTVLGNTRGPWVLDSQSYLTGWYERFGFVVAGGEFIEDGIPHVPMYRAAPSANT